MVIRDLPITDERIDLGSPECDAYLKKLQERVDNPTAQSELMFTS